MVIIRLRCSLNKKNLIQKVKYLKQNAFKNKLMLSYKNVFINLVLFLKFIIPKRGITPLKSFTGQQWRALHKHIRV